MQLVQSVYTLTREFPKSEMFGLTSQLRRAAVSIPSNIAEGSARRHNPEFLHFLSISLGSGAELETQLEIAKGLGFLDSKDFSEIESKLTEVMKMLNVLISKLASKL